MRRTFYTVALLVGLSAIPARADVVAEVGAGAAVPIGNRRWEGVARTSPTVAVAGGYRSGTFVALASLSFTPQRLADDVAVNPSLQRFRGIASIEHAAPLGGHRYWTMRIGLGADKVRERWTDGNLVMHARDETGVGFETAVALWFDTAHGALGLEAAALVGKHDWTPLGFTDTPGYTQIDFALSLVGRFAR